MKKPITTVLIVFGMLVASAMVEVQSVRYIPLSVSLVKSVGVSLELPKLKTKIEMPVIKGHSNFLHAIGFGRKTLNAIGFKKVSNKEFLLNPSIQEQAMLVLLKRNKRTLRREIKKYSGKIINNIYITESGILAAAHLGGAGNVRKFFRKGKNFADGNGTKITSYMKLFANYNLNV